MATNPELAAPFEPVPVRPPVARIRPPRVRTRGVAAFRAFRDARPTRVRAHVGANFANFRGPATGPLAARILTHV